MSGLPFPTLVTLSDTNLTLKDPSQDVRNHKVIDKDGDDVGHVKDLLIDEDTRQVRFLLVASGGFLGIGEHSVMIPAESIIHTGDKTVQVSFSRHHIAQGPVFDADRTGHESFWADAYGHYESIPFWAPGYRPPTRPGER
ncbi:MAG TPA: PRC-barrel domain-containing protein [Thermomicrobiales bacterium]|nr:PRC-barrel domain-containing protein [Thermomicrobiales bacterium]